MGHTNGTAREIPPPAGENAGVRDDGVVKKYAAKMRCR
jgi:hypothetical protein